MNKITTARLSPVWVLFLLVAFPVNPCLAATPERPPVDVIVELVHQRDIADTLEALGTLQANEMVRITANVSDTISHIRFEDGQAVQAGDVLVELTDTEESALLSEAESLAEEAERQFERIERLVAKGTASESLLDERRREWRTAKARLEAVRSRLQDRIISAPFSGHVGLRFVSLGALVSPGDLITTLVDDSRMKLDFTVPALYLSTVRKGTVIEATTPVFPDRRFEGEVSSVDSTIDPVTRSITVRAIVPNDQGDLVPGILMKLNLLRNRRQAIVISEAAIIPRGQRTFVMLVNTSTDPVSVVEREVTLGTRTPGHVEILSGLEIGEEIVTQGTLKLRPGSVVRVRAVDDESKPIAELIRPEREAG